MFVPVKDNCSSDFKMFINKNFMGFECVVSFWRENGVVDGKEVEFKLEVGGTKFFFNSRQWGGARPALCAARSFKNATMFQRSSGYSFLKLFPTSFRVTPSIVN